MTRKATEPTPKPKRKTTKPRTRRANLPYVDPLTALIIRACSDDDPEGQILRDLILDQENHKAMNQEAHAAFNYACISTMSRYMIDRTKGINRTL